MAKFASITIATALIVWSGCAPTAAQVRIDQATATRLAERGTAVSAAGQRISALLIQTLGDPAIANAGSPERLAAAVEARTASISAARAELRAITAELNGLPPLENPDDLDLIRSANQHPRSLADQAERAGTILDALLTVPDSFRARDRARFEAAISAIAGGSVLSIEAQAATMRAQAAMQEQDWPSNAQFLVMACLSDAQAAVSRYAPGPEASRQSTSQLEAARTCISDEVARGRGNVTTNHPLRARLAPLDIAIFDAMDDALGCVSAAHQATRGSPASITKDFNACYIPVGNRILGLVAEQQRILADV